MLSSPGSHTFIKKWYSILFLVVLSVIGTVGWIVLSRYQDSITVPAFHLKDHHHQVISDSIFSEKPTLVYFGYTHCPTICNHGILNISQLLSLAEEQHIPLQALYITLDPERDTEDVLSDYLHPFHQSIRGVTGSPEELNKLYKHFQIFKGTMSNDEMNHSGFVYYFNVYKELKTYVDSSFNPYEWIQTIMSIK